MDAVGRNLDFILTEFLLPGLALGADPVRLDSRLLLVDRPLTFRQGMLREQERCDLLARNFLLYRICYGGLSDKARKTMDEILDTQGYDENGGNMDSRRAERKRKVGVPVIGTRLVREWNGCSYGAIVVHGGFEYEGRRYKSLTAIATAITGTHWNGRAFFGLKKSHEKKSRGAA